MTCRIVCFTESFVSGLAFIIVISPTCVHKNMPQLHQQCNQRLRFPLYFQVLNATRMEFEALEDEAHAIHGDLWEQLNAGVQVIWSTFLLSRFDVVSSEC